MENLTKKVSEIKKNVVTKKTPKKVVTKKPLNLENLTDADLLNLDLDKINLNELLNKNKALKVSLNKSNPSQKESMFKYAENLTDKQKKALRTKARKQRNFYCQTYLEAVQNKNTKLMNSTKADFLKFYKETYLKNDFSLISLCRLNSDASTKINLKIFLKLISKKTIVRKPRTKK